MCEWRSTGHTGSRSRGKESGWWSGSVCMTAYPGQKHHDHAWLAWSFMIMMVIWWLYMSLASWSLHDHGNHNIWCKCDYLHIMIMSWSHSWSQSSWSLYGLTVVNSLHIWKVMELTCDGPSWHVVGWFRPLLDMTGCASGEQDTKLSWSRRDHVVIMIDHVLFATPLITIVIIFMITRDHAWSCMITNDHSFLSNLDCHTVWPWLASRTSAILQLKCSLDYVHAQDSSSKGMNMAGKTAGYHQVHTRYIR